MPEINEFRSLLIRELESRLGRHAGYSLRAFARDLGLQPARLSLILSGKKGLSRASATAIAERLGLSQRERALFVEQVEARHARSKRAKLLASQRLKAHYERLPTRHLSLDAFHAIADWYHLAILELIKWENAKHESSWFAAKLGISPLQAKQAIERLLRLGVITSEGKAKSARYRAKEETVLSPDGVPSEAIKKFHEQVLRRAIDALYLQNVEDRDFCTQISSIRTQDLPAIRRETREFFDRIEVKFANATDGDRIVCISNQIYNLTVSTEENP